ncbi:metal-dependent transcriptional regulator [bacterium]|nr:metal-dependent transcriptional regulator [bacterium]MDD5917914.1 metal-dependent transcriptional regulator [bacterium]
MKIQEAAENYLECILIIGKEKGQVRSVDVAHRLQVTKPTVSITMKQFRENGYVETDEKGILTLTEKGREIAERIYERHVVLTELLLSLGVDEETARADACRMEHDISEITFTCIKEHMRRQENK